MRQVGEEPGWDQPIDQRLLWGTEHGRMRGGRTPGGRPVPGADDTDGGNGGRGRVDRHKSRRTPEHDISQDQEKYAQNPLPSFGG